MTKIEKFDKIDALAGQLYEMIVDLNRDWTFTSPESKKIREKINKLIKELKEEGTSQSPCLHEECDYEEDVEFSPEEIDEYEENFMDFYDAGYAPVYGPPDLY